MTATVRERFEALQEKLGLNQKEMAVYVGVSIRTMNTWATGERSCPDHVIELVERVAVADLEAIEAEKPTTAIMRWALIRSKGTDEFIDYYGSKADALRAAENEWQRLTAYDKKHTESFAVALIKAQYNGGGFQQYDDGTGWVDGDWYEVAKEWK